MFGIKIRYILLGLLLFSLALIFGPILINLLMFNQNKIEVNGNEQLWIPALATYFGALLGGFVSGAMTLFGVKFSLEGSFTGIQLSLEHQKNEKIKESIGIKLNKLYQVKKIVFRLDRMLTNREYGWNEELKTDSLENINSAIYEFILPMLNDLLEISASVDWEFYSEIKNFVESARPLLNSLNNSDLDKLSGIVDELTGKIENEHESRLSNIFENASKIQLLKKNN